MLNLAEITIDYCDKLMSFEAMANKYGVGRVTITKIIKEARLQRTGSVYSKVVKPSKDQLILDYNSGMSTRDIRDKYNTRDTTVDKWFKEYGIIKIPYYYRRSYLDITDIQREFILGSLLGDMSVVKHGAQYRLSVSHCAKQLPYIEHKKDVLGQLSLNAIQDAASKAHNVDVYYNKQWYNHIIGDYNGYILHSINHPYFGEIRSKLYINDIKMVNQWWFGQLTARSLAYWVMDDGSASYNDNSYVLRIATYGFTYNDNVLLQKFLYGHFMLKVNLQPVPNRGYGYCLRFDTENSKKLRDLIAPYIIDCMRYKIDRVAWEQSN